MPLKFIVLHKSRGQTPLAAIEKWKLQHPEYHEVRACYAGRLDPMAEGKLLVLLSDECRRLKKYTRLDKEYEIEVLLDLATDTGDVLGLPAYTAHETHPLHADVRRALNAVTGTHRVPYPAFSSKTMHGKPLFVYALEGTLDAIPIPEHDETIHRIKLLSEEAWPIGTVKTYLENALAVVPRSKEESKRLGDGFRQDLIRVGWRTLFEQIPERKFTVLGLRVACASGTYMRTLAERIGHELGTTALALSINRTEIGQYKKIGPFGFWVRKF